MLSSKERHAQGHIGQNCTRSGALPQEAKALSVRPHSIQFAPLAIDRLSRQLCKPTNRAKHPYYVQKCNKDVKMQVLKALRFRKHSLEVLAEPKPIILEKPLNMPPELPPAFASSLALCVAALELAGRAHSACKNNLKARPGPTQDKAHALMNICRDGRIALF